MNDINYLKTVIDNNHIISEVYINYFECWYYYLQPFVSSRFIDAFACHVIVISRFWYTEHDTDDRDIMTTWMSLDDHERIAAISIWCLEERRRSHGG